MTFAQPIWLLAGAATCAALVLLFVRAARKRRAAVQLLAAASPAVSVALHRRVLRDALAILGTALAFVALARPLGGYHLEAAPTRGVDLMFAVDTSKSMRAADVRPDRLTRAKLAVADLAHSFEGARLGLIAFAGDAFVQAPMTADRAVFLEALDALDTDVIPRGGTDVSSAIRAAEEAMASEPDHRKVLVLLSDGEDLAGSAVAAARDAAAHGLTIYAVGVGSEAGALIEVPDASGQPQLVRDEAGNPVHSHLDEATLRAIAQVTGGAYAPLGADGRGLASLYAAARAHLPVSTAAGTQRRVYAERFQIPLALAIACLLAELVIGDRRRRRARAAGRLGRMGRLGTAALVAGVALAPAVASAAPASGAPEGDYNAGTTAYRKGDFAGAQKQFESALHTSDLHLQALAYYDLGNARYRAGEATLAKQDRAATIEQWKQAVAAYDAALALEPKDADARFNKDFVAKRLAQLEKEEQQNKDQQKQQNQQNQQQKQSQGQQGQQQQNQAQQGQQQQNQSQQGQQQQNQSQQGQQQQNQAQQGQQQQQNQGQKGQQQQNQGQQANGSNANDQQKTGQQQNQGQQQQNQRQQANGSNANDQQKTGQQQNQGQQQQNQRQQANGSNANGQQKNQQQNEGQQANGSSANGQHTKQQQPKADLPDAGSGSAQPTGHEKIGELAGSGAAARDKAQTAAEAGAQQTAGETGVEQTAAEARADAERRAAGQMTHGEAVQLLDSVAHDLRPMPIRGRNRGTPTHPTTKDW